MICEISFNGCYVEPVVSCPHLIRVYVGPSVSLEYRSGGQVWFKLLLGNNIAFIIWWIDHIKTWQFDEFTIWWLDCIKTWPFDDLIIWLLDHLIVRSYDCLTWPFGFIIWLKSFDLIIRYYSLGLNILHMYRWDPRKSPRKNDIDWLSNACLSISIYLILLIRVFIFFTLTFFSTSIIQVYCISNNIRLDYLLCTYCKSTHETKFITKRIWYWRLSRVWQSIRIFFVVVISKMAAPIRESKISDATLKNTLVFILFVLKWFSLMFSEIIKMCYIQRYLMNVPMNHRYITSISEAEYLCR